MSASDLDDYTPLEQTASSDDNYDNTTSTVKARSRKTSKTSVRKPEKPSQQENVKSYRAVVREFAQSLTATVPNDTETFTSSYIGRSLWTRKEKRAFFSALDRHGPQALDRLAAVVRTKTTQEIRAYVIALQTGLEDHVATLDPRSVKLSKVNDEAAAHEISEQCEVAMNSLALQLEMRLHDDACAAEFDQYGDDWIIDADRADKLEAEDKSAPEAHKPEFSETDGDESDVPSLSAAESEDEATARSTDIISPSALIGLSRNVFMNDNADLSLRWDSLPVRSPGADGPALLRSAFEMLQDICVDYITRLTQAAHFQAMTRLRARRDGGSAPKVRSIDVWTALSIMDVPRPDQHEYWQKALQRYEIDVYSAAQRYNDGRRLLRDHGYKLSQRELAQALSKNNIDDDHAAVNDVDDEPFEGDDSSSEELDPEAQADARFTEYLDVHDLERSRQDENFLRSIVKLPPLIKTIDVSMPRPLLDIDQSVAASQYNFREFKADWEMRNDMDAVASTRVQHKRRRIDM